MPKPRGYWKDIQNVIRETRAAAARLGHPRTMPTDSELREIGENSLAIAILNNGGAPAFAEKCRLKPNRLPNKFFEGELNTVIALHCVAHLLGSPGVMPTSEQLKSLRQFTLLTALKQYHGGVKKAAKKAKLSMSHDKKPDGHYNNFENLSKDVADFIANHGQPGFMPTHSELSNHGHSGLSAAISSHGGFPRVAGLLGLHPGRRPNGYWTPANIREEIKSFVEQHGLGKQFPSGKTLRFFDAADLDNAIARNGGVRNFATELKLEVSGGQENGYWSRDDNLTREITTFIQRHGRAGEMPTQAELTAHGRSDLNNAIYRHGGGHSHFAETHQLALREKPKGYWSRIENLRSELTEFNKYYGHPGVMPRQDHLRDAGFSYLDSGITKYGGYYKAAEDLGWSMRSVSLRPRSEIEIRIAHELRTIWTFDVDDHSVACNSKRYDCDIVLREHRLVIEFDSWKWHSGTNNRGVDRLTLDKKKGDVLRADGWRVIRLREKYLALTHRDDLSVSGNGFKKMCNAIARHVAKIVGLRPASRLLNRYVTSTIPLGTQAADEYIRRILEVRSGQ